ncbi:tetratricopeptide repeat protein [Streptomyces sp. NPDC053367]|uniref:tetratricopeptide repeat protein n=1 Tax=Streptomyces sp. NPDC053367 TaxID=3365700 RepID=UPI0037CEF19D
MRALRGRAKTRRRDEDKLFSQREIEKALGRPPYSVSFRGKALSEWLPDDVEKAQVPHDADVVWALVRLWCDWAGEAQPDERHWRNLVERAQPVRAPQPGQRPVGRLIAEYADHFVLDDLEVHPCIEVGEGTQLGPLPAYVEREHDARLCAVVDAARTGKSGIALLVGGSSTGKSRSCWEAVKTLPDGWRLWHPIEPEPPTALTGNLKQVAPKTVVWLGEAQHYLLDQDHSVQVASGLRELLNDAERAPVLVLGTMWREQWDALTAIPASWDGSEPDPYAQARQLVKNKSIAVPDVFTADELKAAQTAALGDPRLSEALQRAEQGQITQYLASAPALIERYNTAPPGAKALIEAAMDALRIGHGRALPLTLLEAAAECYLTDIQCDLLDDDWFGQALAYTTRPLRGARGPLTRIRPRRAQPAPAMPSYRLADYLEQYGRSHRRFTRSPAPLWDALLHYVSPTSLGVLGSAAEDRGLLHVAARFYIAAAETGDATGMRHLAGLLEQAGRTKEAIYWWQRAADGEHTGAIAEHVASMLEKEELTAEALRWWQRAADAGSSVALDRTGELLEELGHIEEAICWWQHAVDITIGDDAVRSAYIGQGARLLAKSGRVEEAMDRWMRAVQTDHFMGLLTGVPDELVAIGRDEEALNWLRPRAKAGDANALTALRQLQDASNRASRNVLHESVEEDQTKDTIRPGQATDMTDELSAARQAAEQLLEGGRITEEAIGKLHRAGVAGNSRALELGSAVLWSSGKTDEAIRWWQCAAEQRDTPGASYTSSAHYAASYAAKLMDEAGRTEEAIRWLQNRAETGDANAAKEATRMLVQAGHLTRALHWLEECAAAGQRYALAISVQLLAEVGRVDESRQLKLYGWEPDGSIAKPWEAKPQIAI